MRILLFNWRSILSHSAGGAETHCYEIFNRIAEKGNLVQLVASCDDLTKPERMMIGKIRTLHVNRKEIFYPFSSFLGLRKISFGFFDVIVEDISKFPMFWPLLFSKVFSKPFVAIVHHVHGKTLLKELPFPLNASLYFFELFGLKLYSLFEPYVVTVSESTKHELISLGFSEERIKVIPNGLDFKPLSVLSFEKKSAFPLIVYFGRVKKYKRLDHLIQAAKQVYLEVRNVKIIIAGKGDAEVYAELHTLANQIGVGDIVKFYGEVDKDERNDVLQKAWVYAIASMKEGFGISVIEAQAFGVPVVAYAVPGLIDSVKHLDSGILVKNGAVQNFADALIMICRNKMLREKLSKGAIENASQYDWAKSADELLRLLTSFSQSRTRLEEDRFKSTPFQK